MQEKLKVGRNYKNSHEKVVLILKKVTRKTGSKNSIKQRQFNKNMVLNSAKFSIVFGYLLNSVSLLSRKHKMNLNYLGFIIFYILSCYLIEVLIF